MVEAYVQFLMHLRLGTRFEMGVASAGLKQDRVWKVKYILSIIWRICEKDHSSIYSR